MKTISLSLDEICKLANKTLLANGCDEENANVLSDTIMSDEGSGLDRDRSTSKLG